ncbi:MAG: AMP-binding protein, partial [Methylococcus sp.]
MNIARTLEQGRAAFPYRSALVFEGETWSYAQLDADCGRVAQVLANLGIGRGDRVALWLPNSPAFVFAYFGALKLGAVVVAVNPQLKAAELAFMLEDSGARVLVTTAMLADSDLAAAPFLERILVAEGAPEGADALERLMGAAEPWGGAAAMTPDEPAAILYTSGTTGVPKGAVLTHGNIVDNGRACVAAFGLVPQDRVLLCLPLYHCFGQNAAFNPCFEAGATLLLHRQFGPATVARAVTEDAATVFFGVPTLYDILLDQAEPPDWRGVRRCISAASALPPRVAEAWRSRFRAPIQSGYGLTETCLACFNRDPAGGADSVGTPLDGVAVKVIAADGRDAVLGETGELAVRGSNVTRGYWNRPEATAEVFRDGWFLTGDMGRMDETGAVRIVDRVKDMINVGGTKVYPSEVVAVLARHPAVAEAAVYGVPDAMLGEGVAAAVVLRTACSATPAELMAFCGQHLADFKIPGRVEWLEALPKSVTGKVLKRVLAERYRVEPPEETADMATPTCSLADIETWLTRWIASRLAVDAAAVAADRALTEYGITSLLAVSLAGELGAWLGRDLPPTLVWRFPTVASIGRYLARGQGDPVRLGAIAPISSVPRRGPLPLSFIQEEVWRRDRSPALRGIYKLLLRLRFDGRLDDTALRESFDVLAARHELLRTRYSEFDGTPVQTIMPTAEIPWTAVDLRGLPEAARTAEIQRLEDAEANYEFDLAHGPALRATLLRLAETRYLLLIAIHHISIDAWSAGLLVNELGSIYAARASGEPVALPPQSIQYADFAHWQRRVFSAEALAAQSAYWRELLSTLPPEMCLPTDRPRPPEHGEKMYAAGAEEVFLPADLVNRLKDLGRRHDATLYMVLLAAYTDVLRRHSGSEDILIGAPTSKRTRPELDTLIGHFAGRSWLRIDLSGQPDFPELLARTRQVVLAALDNQYLTLRQWIAATAGHVEWRPERPLAARATFNLWPPISTAIDVPGATL